MRIENLQERDNMANLNLRGVPDPLYKALKVEAAETGIPLIDVCVNHLSRGIGFLEMSNGEIEKPSKKKSLTKPKAQSLESGQTAPKIMKTVEDVPKVVLSVSPDVSRCLECGSIGRVHQKGCSKG